MEHNEIINLVRELSLELMNTGKGDGTMRECYSDNEIIDEFGHLNREEIIAEVTRIEALRAEMMNEVLAASGEYDFPEDGQPVLKEW